MTLREALVTKIEHFKSRPEDSAEVQWMRQRLAAEDKRLLSEETDRLKARGFSFASQVTALPGRFRSVLGDRLAW